MPGKPSGKADSRRRLAALTLDMVWCHKCGRQAVPGIRIGHKNGVMFRGRLRALCLRCVEAQMERLLLPEDIYLTVEEYAKKARSLKDAEYYQQMKEFRRPGKDHPWRGRLRSPSSERTG